MRYSRRQFTKSTLIATAGCTSLLTSTLGQTESTVHLVEKGDTLSHLARRYDTTVSAIKRANNLPSDTVRVGQKLKIPRSSTTAAAQSSLGTTHVVQEGDTLGHLAVRYGVSVSEIKQANNLSSDLVRVNQVLQIPSTNRPKDDLLTQIRQKNARVSVRRDKWNTIVVHHSAIKYGNATIYDRSHRERGMRNGLAYHFVIGNGIDSADGEIEMGPRWFKQLHGGHVRSYKVNQTAIGICLIGNFEQTHPSKKQLDAFIQLMDWLRGDVLRKKVRFAGHKDIERNLCPGKNFPLAAMHARYD